MYSPSPPTKPTDMLVINDSLPRLEHSRQRYEMFISAGPPKQLTHPPAGYYCLEYTHDEYVYFCQRVSKGAFEIIDESDDNVRQLPDWSDEALCAFAMWVYETEPAKLVSLERLEEEHVHALANIRKTQLKLDMRFLEQIKRTQKNF